MLSHRIVQADNLPTPAGPYSPATVFERLVFVAGQGARVPATGTLASLDIEAQTEQCLRNVEAILVAAGSSLQHVLRCGVFLIDMGEFSRMNRSTNASSPGTSRRGPRSRPRRCRRKGCASKSTASPTFPSQVQFGAPRPSTSIARCA